MENKFITLEGIEGVGKTTAIQFIKQYLQEKKIDFILTREPGGTALGEEIRHILLTHRTQADIDIKTELLLLFAARAQHIAEVIKPNLAQGKMVICDRFTDATYAYQGGGRKIKIEYIQQLEHIVQETLQPDKTILLHAPVELALQRAHSRGKPDRFESEKIDFFQRTQEAYFQRAKQDPNRFVLIDASLPIESVQQQLIQFLTSFIKH